MNDSGMWTRALAAGAAVALTPILVRAISKSFPPRPARIGDFDALRTRYRTIEGWSQVIAIFAAWGAIAFMLWMRVGNTFWLIGVLFGWLVLAPVIFIAVCTLPKGLFCWSEFWRYYELRYQVSLALIGPLYAALCLLGVVSTIVILARQ